MKKILLSLFVCAAFLSNAQVLNESLENWKTDTTFFQGFAGTIPPDTFSFEDPIDWTSSNALSGADSLGGIAFVSKDSGVNAYHGQYSMKLITDSIKPISVSGIPFRLTLGGFALNGYFEVNATSLFLGSGNLITPIAIKGAGQPMTQRLGKLAGYFQYDPVFNPNTNAYDTCIIWATLRKGLTPIADAIFKSTDSTGGFRHFSADFVYQSCELPDTLVIFVSSSVPNVQTILGGSSGLVRGSALWVDSIYYENLPGGYNFAPIARNDVDTTSKNTAKNVVVKLNDEDCDDLTPTLTVTVASQPVNGSAAVVANVITYTPNNNFVGIDSFTYTLSDGQASSNAKVRMLVLNASGISEANEVPVTIYPVPANNELHVQFENTGKATARVYDMLGNLVITSGMNGNNNLINTSGLASGFYGIQILDEKNAVIARSKFTVTK